MKRILVIMILFLTLGAQSAYALTPVPPDAPMVSAVTATTATVAVPVNVLTTMTEEQKTRTYFEISEPEQMCIMIYPTPVECLPKKTTLGIQTTTLTNLKPNTKYTVSFKRDNTIRCITTPCPGNEYQSTSTTFTTLPASTTSPIITRYLTIGSRGNEVIALQAYLHTEGYLTVTPTGYYGTLTRAAVSMYQTNDMHIPPTGTVGPLTRASLISPTTEETFTGNITAVSTACFADGECSVSVDGNKIVTTIGWSRDIVGSIKGKFTDIGSLENQIGASVKVYAKKTSEGYTLYGNANYYIEVL